MSPVAGLVANPSDTSQRPSSPKTQVPVEQPARAPVPRRTLRTGSSPEQQRHQSNGDPGLYDEERSRFVGTASAVAFPRVLGLDLQSKRPQPLHSIGFHLGIRPEEPSAPRQPLSSLVSRDAFFALAGVYFNTMGCVTGIPEKQAFLRRCQEYYENEQQQLQGESAEYFVGVMAGVAALGSLFSHGHDYETQIVQYAKGILEDAASIRRPSIDLITGWILRVVYLRSTTRPNNAWMASCSALHLAEALGLHRDENIVRLASALDPGMGYDADELRRLFWMAWSVHAMTSYEYGRSCITLSNVTCALPGDDSMHVISQQFLQIMQTIPSSPFPHALDSEGASAEEQLYSRIMELANFAADHPFIVWSKADLIFCFYRRLRQFQFIMPAEITEALIRVGNESVAAALQTLVAERQPYFNALGSIFHFACILMALNTPASLANVGAAMSALEAIANVVDTAMVRQTLDTARQLLNDCIERKSQDLETLQGIGMSGPRGGTSSAEPVASVDLQMPGSGPNPMVGWDAFMDDFFLSGGASLEL